jgi:N-acetyl-gamma-glutamyl-phosphate reductase
VIDVAVVGAAGYAGIEAVRLVLGHPGMRLTLATSGQEAGKAVADVYPALSGLTDVVFSDPDPSAVADAAELALLAVPHTASLELTPSLLERGVTVIDASADFRFKDAAVYEDWYGTTHTSPELLKRAVYGLPELDRSALPGATLVAAPGCYPTASILASLPALELGVVDAQRVIVDAKSGVSGAGRTVSAGTHFPVVNESLAPYKVADHRHTPEIEQALSAIAGTDVRVVFTPHLVPMTRGLLATVYLDLGPGALGLTTEEAVAIERDRYAGEPFVSVHAAGVMPSTHEVSGTNRAHIGVAVDRRAGMLIAACAIDNLIKGTSGQALQCANLVFGLPETEGLLLPGAVV